MADLLIVDDDPSIRGLLSRALADVGQIHVATGGAEALVLLGRRRYDCIFLDLHMPQIDGFRVLQLLGKGGVNQDTPVYVITADVSNEGRIRALSDRATVVMTKPISVRSLRTLVTATLDAKKK